jgi:uncharacterized protein (DUF1015 family)
MEIRAFRGWRFVGGASGDISPFIAPPYDILSGQDKQRLLAACPNNIVAVDMPHVPPKEEGPQQEYRSAAELLETWKAGGILRRDDRPTIYVYQQTYSWGGRRYVRRGMICGVRGTELGPDKDVIPHEHVFAGPLADRLQLTRHTQMQLSPIFGFYADPGGAVRSVLDRAAQAPPIARGELDGVAERLWAIDDPADVARIAQALQPVPVFIADGHHRYTTAMNYRNQLAAAGGKLAADHEANFVMFALVAHDDPGLVILPTHRIFTNLDPSVSVERLAAAAPEFSWRRAGAGEASAAAVEALLNSAGPAAMVMVAGPSATAWIVELTNPAAMAQAAPDQTPEWRALPTAILHKLIIEKALRPWVKGDLQVEYTPQAGVVLDACRSGRAPLGVILPGIPVQSVEAVALSGASMPHKSTYFYPKIATGMVLKPLT